MEEEKLKSFYNELQTLLDRYELTIDYFNKDNNHIYYEFAFCKKGESLSDILK